MSWKKKKILVVVKSYPEKSHKYDSVVCTAGITDDGEFIRLYPVPFESFRGSRRIPKFAWIEAEVQKASGEKLSRKESYKVREGSIKIVDNSLRNTNPVDWVGRNKWVLPLVSDSVESLQEQFNSDRTSLGLVKPKQLYDFYKTQELSDLMDSSVMEVRQKTLWGEDRTLLEKLPHIFKYRFSCESDGGCKHDMTCEDWELFESFRSWRHIYSGPDELWEKIRLKYFDKMINEKNLYFFMGTYSLFPTWMIIGLYYPPKHE